MSRLKKISEKFTESLKDTDFKLSGFKTFLKHGACGLLLASTVSGAFAGQSPEPITGEGGLTQCVQHELSAEIKLYKNSDELKAIISSMEQADNVPEVFSDDMVNSLRSLYDFEPCNGDTLDDLSHTIAQKNELVDTLVDYADYKFYLLHGKHQPEHMVEFMKSASTNAAMEIADSIVDGNYKNLDDLVPKVKQELAKRSVLMHDALETDKGQAMTYSMKDYNASEEPNKVDISKVLETMGEELSKEIKDRNFEQEFEKLKADKDYKFAPKAPKAKII